MVPFDHPRRARDMLHRFTGVRLAETGMREPGQSSDTLKEGVRVGVGGHSPAMSML